LFRTIHRPEPPAIVWSFTIGNNILAFGGVQPEIMSMTEISYPFVRHPLACPRFITGKRVISVAQGGDVERGSTRKFIAGLAIEKRINLEAFVKSVSNKYVYERR
jgi:hypothetical protein